MRSLPLLFCNKIIVLLILSLWTSSGYIFRFPSQHRLSSRFAVDRCLGSRSGSNFGKAYIKHASSNAADQEIRKGGWIPQHVGFICDGNSRWAKRRNLPTSAGHVAGADRFIELVDQMHADGIQYCTFYGFSTENWNRPRYEIEAIFRLMERTATGLIERLRGEGCSIDVKILGQLQDERIPQSLKGALQDLEQLSKKSREASIGTSETSNCLTVCLAINYGGRQDIVQACQKIASAIQNGDLGSPNDVSEIVVESYLYTAGIPDPDLIVRTGGESRLSNFLLWNSAYSEIYISPELWPDFDKNCWQKALGWYRQRQRRFGARLESDENFEKNLQF